MHGDQMRKYGISESIVQALIMTLLPTMSYHGFRDAIHSHLVTMHQAPGASCGIHYYPCLVSCHFYVIPTYPF